MGHRKADVVAAALNSVATLVSRSEDASELVEAIARTGEAAISRFEQVLDLTETEAHIAVGSVPYTSYHGETRYRDSALYREVDESFGFRVTRWHGRSPVQAVASITSKRISVRRARELRQVLELPSNERSISGIADGAAGDAMLAVDSTHADRQRVHGRFVRQPSVREIEILTAQACHASAGQRGLLTAKRWGRARHGGDMEFSELACLAAFRDVLGLELPSHRNFSHREQATIEGSVRVMHEEFCIVCDFPEVLKLDEQNRPHCSDGPSHRWRDGWALYHWHGTRVPQAWIEDQVSLTAAFALTVRNTELRRAALEIVGWHNVLRALNGKIVAEDPDPQHGRLVDVTLPGRRYPSRFLHVHCATGREFAVGIPRRYRTVKGAHAWLTGLPTRKLKFPTVRT